MENLKNFIQNKITKTKYGIINISPVKRLFAKIPGMDSELYEHELNSPYVCSEILSIRKYENGSVIVTFINLGKDNLPKKKVSSSDTKHVWRHKTYNDLLAEVEFSEDYNNFLKDGK